MKRPGKAPKKYGKKPRHGNFDPRKKYLCPGAIGFLISYTKDRDDKATSQDIFRILNRFDEEATKKIDAKDDKEVASNEVKDDQDPAQAQGSESDDSEIFDLSKALAQEVSKGKPENAGAGANSQTKSAASEASKDRPQFVHKYHRLDPEVKNMMFISAGSETPAGLLATTEKIFTTSELLKIKNFSKFLPVIASCKVGKGSEDNLDAVSDAVKEVVKSGVIGSKGWDQKRVKEKEQRALRISAVVIVRGAITTEIVYTQFM